MAYLNHDVLEHRSIPANPIRYQITAKNLKWQEESKELIFEDEVRGQKTVWQLDTYHFLSLEIVGERMKITAFDHVVNRILSAANCTALASKQMTHQKQHMIVKNITTIINLYDFLQTRGIFYLSESTQEDFDVLADLLGKGGWDLALKTNDKWNRLLADLATGVAIPDDVFTFAGKKIYSIKKTTSRMYGGIDLKNCSTENKKNLEKFLDDSKIQISTQFRLHLRNPTETKNTSRQRLYLILGFINRLEYSTELDNLNFIPYRNNLSISRKKAKRPDNRTENLSLEAAVTLISSSLKFLYEFGPEFLKVLDGIINTPVAMGSGKEEKLLTEWSSKYQSEYLRQYEPFAELTFKMKIEGILRWNRQREATTDLKNPSVRTILGMIITACSIIIQVMNARRISEIIDKQDGLKIDSLTHVDEELCLFKCEFFIRKTYQCKSEFFVTKTTKDAIYLLTELKRRFARLAKSEIVSDSLFEIHLFPAKNETQAHYVWQRSKSSLILDSKPFLAYTFPDNPTNSYKPHQARRFFAILYHYRYDNSDLISLSQHLRHLDIVMTKHYVSDPASREAARSIAAALNLSRNETELDTGIAELALKEIEDELTAVGEERLFEFVSRILEGQSLYGGLAKYVLRLNRSLSKNVEYGKLPPESKAKGIFEHLLSKQYAVKPMPHGVCMAPDISDTIHTPCQLDSRSLNRHLASPNMCIACRYHITSKLHLECLKHDAEQLESDTRDFRLSPMQQIAAREDYENLLRIIEITDAKRCAEDGKYQTEFST